MYYITTATASLALEYSVPEGVLVPGFVFVLVKMQ
jgi:hypothetical protein